MRVKVEDNMETPAKIDLITGVDAFSCGIQKKLLYAGKTQVNYMNGSKIYFHYKTLKKNGVQLDDSKQYNKPMELIVGKKFKLEVWEKCLQTMWLNEISQFSVIKDHVLNYASVSKQLRDYYKSLNKCPHDHDHDHDHQSSSHQCGFHAINNGLGYKDLDELFSQPEDLDFIFEIVKVEQPDEYEKEAWSLNDKERLESIPRLKEDGNKFYNEKNYLDAAEKYHLAIAYLEELMMKEKPNDIEWNELNEIKLKILSNYSQCKLCLNDYYAVLEHTNTILDYDKKNIKAFYRRAKALKATHNYDAAKHDLNEIIKLDVNMKNLCLKELNEIEEMIKINNEKEKEMFKGKLF